MRHALRSGLHRSGTRAVSGMGIPGTVVPTVRLRLILARPDFSSQHCFDSSTTLAAIHSRRQVVNVLE
jgi:hypothetical protein